MRPDLVVFEATAIALASLPNAQSCNANFKQWEGPPLNTAAAEEIFGASASFTMSQVLQQHSLSNSFLELFV